MSYLSWGLALLMLGRLCNLVWKYPLLVIFLGENDPCHCLLPGSFTAYTCHKGAWSLCSSVSRLCIIGSFFPSFLVFDLPFDFTGLWLSRLSLLVARLCPLPVSISVSPSLVILDMDLLSSLSSCMKVFNKYPYIGNGLTEFFDFITDLWNDDLWNEYLWTHVCEMTWVLVSVWLAHRYYRRSSQRFLASTLLDPTWTIYFINNLI